MHVTIITRSSKLKHSSGERKCKTWAKEQWNLPGYNPSTKADSSGQKILCGCCACADPEQQNKHHISCWQYVLVHSAEERESVCGVFDVLYQYMTPTDRHRQKMWHRWMDHHHHTKHNTATLCHENTKHSSGQLWWLCYCYYHDQKHA